MPQFSLQLLLITVGAIAAAVAAITVEPTWMSLTALKLLSVTFATAAAIAVRCTSGRRQVFWIGFALPVVLAALVGSLSVLFIVTIYIEVNDVIDYALVTTARALRVVLPMFWCFAPVCGLCAVLMQSVFFTTRRTVHEGS